MNLPTGGTITTDGLYTVHRFNAGGTFHTDKAITVEYLVCGSGGTGGVNGRGAGGGGQVLTGNLSIAAGDFTIQVGIARAWQGNNEPSWASGSSIFSTVTALGGRDGGDPAGGTDYADGGAYQSGTGGSGVAGTNSTITGESLWFGSGGGGAGTSGSGVPGPSAGWGGRTGVNPTTGDPNQGGGSGGQAVGNTTNPSGASGTVIIRYLTSLFDDTAGSPLFFRGGAVIG